MTQAGRGRSPQADMDAERVLELLADFAREDIAVWLDGGWAVDALLGEQTRPHDDLDVVSRAEDNDRIVGVLDERGYAVKYDASPSCFVLVDSDGHQVDVHPATFAPNGDGIYRMENGDDWIFPAAGFRGSGHILGREVPCLAPEVVLVNHSTGYELDEEHERDVIALSRRYGLPLPRPEPPDSG